MSCQKAIASERVRGKERGNETQRVRGENVRGRERGEGMLLYSLSSASNRNGM